MFRFVLGLATLLVPQSALGQAKANPTYGLKAPFTAEDNNHWETGAGTKVESNFVRLTPAVPNRSGYLWSRIPVTMTDWKVGVGVGRVGKDWALVRACGCVVDVRMRVVCARVCACAFSPCHTHSCAQFNFDFRISGSHPTGGDGLAFWFVEKKMLGTVFGSADYCRWWSG